MIYTIRKDAFGSLITGVISTNVSTKYKFETDTVTLPGLLLYKDSQVVGMVKTELGIGNKIGIIIDNEKKDILEKKGLFNQTLGLEVIGWKLFSENKDLNNYEIIDRKKRTLAIVTNSNNRLKCEIIDEKNEIIILLMILAVILYQLQN